MNLASTTRQSTSTADVSIGSYADLAIEYYDSARHPTCANFREASAVFLAEELAAFDWGEGLVAEIGSGRSLVAELLPAGALDRSRLVLVDAAYEMLAHSAGWLAVGALGIVADARQLPVKDDHLKLIVIALGDPFNDQALWHEVGRVLRPNGLCLFTAPAFEWAQSYRSMAGARMDLAEFVTAGGETVAVPSFILPPSRQQEIIAAAGLVVLRQRSVTLGEISCTPRSPKLLPSRGADAPIIDAFAIGAADHRLLGAAEEGVCDDAAVAGAAEVIGPSAPPGFHPPA